MLRYFGIFIILLFISCASFTDYADYRRKDLQDIATIGVESKAIGFGVRISFLSLGFFFQGKTEEATGYGLRGGSISEYQTSQLVFGFLGGETFVSGEVLKDSDGKPIINNGIPLVLDSRDNLKSHKLKYMSFYKDPPVARRKRQKDKERREIITDLVEKTGDETLLLQIPAIKKKANGYSPEYLYQVEVFLGVYGGVRLGINFAEVLDFILGLSSLDILEDDVQGQIDKEDL
jgi:hypothetical protein